MNPLVYVGDATEALVYAPEVEESAEAQIRAFVDCPAFEGSTIRVMPDVHAGAGAVIGFTAPLPESGRVVPNVVGVDGGCGVLSHPVPDAIRDFRRFDAIARLRVPLGHRVHVGTEEEARASVLVHDAWTIAEASGALRRYRYPDVWFDAIEEVRGRVAPDLDRLWRSLGTLGGGNHFIELGEDATGSQWLTVHSGSRNFGLRVATYHQGLASRVRPEWGDLAWLDGDEARRYLDDLAFVQEYAAVNRAAIVLSLLGRTVVSPGAFRESVHNYVGADGVIRKGAISAARGEHVVIPWNMRDGLVFGLGKGNADWNESAPHGAGRRLPRGEARRTLDAEAFVRDLRDSGVWSSSAGPETLDEAPEAYKAPEEVEAYLADTVRVIARVRPVYSLKDDTPRRKRKGAER